ncbi:hypothetical protein QTO34_002858 [Cnephaeus nilssonii]|uniref:Uncharacterized protein n=1 Tax=Cnephaeus nilssonii TaxID=3371016 RepID=A0AA40LME6_CNENI|nr:hypothetical protein QTO34_002858 [Eptesicus nilssonii]
MPVDPNEPTYCLCHQVSYGEMIGCDNPDVSVGHAVVGFCRKMRDLETGSRTLRHPSPPPPCPVGPWAGSCTRWAGMGRVSDRVVSLCLCRPDYEAQRKMVLSSVRPGEEEEEVRKRLTPGQKSKLIHSFIHVAIFYLHLKATLF